MFLGRQYKADNNCCRFQPHRMTRRMKLMKPNVALLHNQSGETLFSSHHTHPHSTMSHQAILDYLENELPRTQPGDINELERWWVDRQVALEQAGYMLRSRYRPGWKPSWTGTKSFYLDCEDGRSVHVSDRSFFFCLPSPMILAASRHGRNSHL